LIVVSRPLSSLSFSSSVFLNRNLRVKLFTPRARDIFNFIPTDVGRGLSDITSKLEDDRLIADAEKVLEMLQPVERTVHTWDGRAFLIQICPAARPTTALTAWSSLSWTSPTATARRTIDTRE
jgi:hypothetical protein